MQISTAKPWIKRFQQWWPEENNFNSVVHYFWRQRVEGKGTQANTFAHVVCFLHKLAKDIQLNFKVQLDHLRKGIPEACLQGDFYHERLLNEEYLHILHEQELYWHQRSHVAWIQAGDRNTQFFQRKASS